jgi:dihydrofolate reductase
MILSIITAVARNGTIGAGDKLPWDMPADMQYFMQTTMGRHVIMGRKAFQDIGKPLAGRTNIVITRNTAYTLPFENTVVVHSLNDAVECARKRGEKEAFIIGGEQIYRLGLVCADKLYLTRIHADFDGDTVFPSFDESVWRECSHRDFPADLQNLYPYSFSVFERIPSTSYHSS